MQDKFITPSVQFKYNVEDSSTIEGASVAFECRLVEEDGGISSFAGTAQLHAEETTKYLLGNVDKAVMTYIANRLLAMANAE